MVEKRRDGHATTLGAASGSVAGLVAITPSCGSVDLVGALVVGLAAGVLCSYAVSWKFRWGVDDSLDVVGVHLMGGVVGTLLIGLLATATMTGGPKGLFYGGGLGQLGRQAVAVAAVGTYAFVVTYGIGKGIDRLMGFRASEDEERTGLDLTVHAETAYDHGVLTHGMSGGAAHTAAAAHLVASPAEDRSPWG
jgi:Amt family ammonium transporter